MIRSRQQQLTDAGIPVGPTTDRWPRPRTRPFDEGSEPDLALKSLSAGRDRLARMTAAERVELLSSCVTPLDSVAGEWVDLSCAAKGIPEGSRTRYEEILTGPVSVMRQLQTLLQTMGRIARRDPSLLPGRLMERKARLGVVVTPCDGFWDWATFLNFRATTWMQPEVDRENLKHHIAPAWSHPDRSGTSLVLGAGNVGSIPAADLLSKLCIDNRTVLLKMSPVNDYLGPLLERAFKPLIDHDLLRIVYGGASIGAAAIADERVDDIHVTGSAETYNRIVWGEPGPVSQSRRESGSPATTKPITSELGSVSPWIVVPGDFSSRQLSQQAENLVGSLVNNAAFNCVSTRVIVTWKQWPERENLMQRVQSLLSAVPQRQAYYPGAAVRYADFSGLSPERARREMPITGSDGAGTTVSIDGRSVFLAGTGGNDSTLPWTLLRNVDSRTDELLFSREAFVCVCAEVVIDAASPKEFFSKAVDFANNRLWGTLSVSMTVPDGFRRGHRDLLQDGVDRLQYGSVSINQWAALIFALMTPPWGGWPDSPRTDIQSGTGWVHNSLMLTGIEKTVLEAPLVVLPKPLWHPTHPDPVPGCNAMYDLMKTPSSLNMARLAFQSVRGVLAGGR